jgi:hypothetical protein
MSPMPESPEGQWQVTLVAESDLDEESFTLDRAGKTETVGLHDYATLYSIPGLYEQVIQKMLGCRSPEVAVSSLLSALSELGRSPDECRVLDLGAGNGIVGELLHQHGINHIVGVDVLPEAREACLRDRPGVYSSYEVVDLRSIDPVLAARLQKDEFTALTCVGALGGEHVSASALLQAINTLLPRSLVILTLHENWLVPSQREGIGAALRQLLVKGHLDLLHSKRFLHRLSTSGAEIFYLCLVAARGGSQK